MINSNALHLIEQVPGMVDKLVIVLPLLQEYSRLSVVDLPGPPGHLQLLFSTLSASAPQLPLPGNLWGVQCCFYFKLQILQAIFDSIENCKIFTFHQLSVTSSAPLRPVFPIWLGREVELVEVRRLEREGVVMLTGRFRCSPEPAGKLN